MIGNQWSKLKYFVINDFDAVLHQMNDDELHRFDRTAQIL